MAGDLVISTINGGAIGAKNAIINGNFGINQRGVSGTVTLSAGDYGHDRFKAGASGCTYTFATSNNVTTLTITAGSLIQVIEGINLQSGTYVLSWAGTAQGKIGAGSYSGSGVTGTAVGGTNLNVEFNTGTLSLVQLEEGSVATPFEHRQYGQELALCQRYFRSMQRQAGNTGTAFAIGTCYGNSYVYITSGGAHPVEMRSTPTISTVSTFRVEDAYSSAWTVSSISVGASTSTVFSPSIALTTGATAGRVVYLQATDDASRIQLSAEL